MSLLDTLKSLLGLGSSRQQSGSSGDVGVTVEREPESDADSTEPRPPQSPTTSGSDDVEPDAQSEHEVKGTDEAEGAPEESADDAAAGHPGSGVDTTEIKGVGPAYADRLSDAGIDDVAGLAAADPETLAEQTDLSEKRVGRWVERAQAW